MNQELFDYWLDMQMNSKVKSEILPQNEYKLK